MKLDNVLFLAAKTARSQAYAQAMFQFGILPARVFLFGQDGVNKPGQTKKVFFSPANLNLPNLDLSETLDKTVKKFACPVAEFSVDNVNDTAVLEALCEDLPQLVIYSGYGGQIVSKELLSLGVPFLHIHSGWLPEFRGSTTVYYSILQERWCGVSAILMSPQIDMGKIVGQKKYPLPEAGVDIDYYYDSALRADLLVEMLLVWSKNNKFTKEIIQDHDGGTEYYVIHPLLKHLSILSLSVDKTNKI